MSTVLRLTDDKRAVSMVVKMAQSASRDDGISLPPPPCESASSSTLRSVPLDRVAMALQQNSAADMLQPSQPPTTPAQHQLAAR